MNKVPQTESSKLRIPTFSIFFQETLGLFSVRYLGLCIKFTHEELSLRRPLRAGLMIDKEQGWKRCV